MKEKNNNYITYLNEADKKNAEYRSQLEKLENDVEVLTKRNDDLEYKCDEMEAEIETYKHVFREEQNNP